MTPSLGFNKPETANFTFDCVRYLMPKERISNFSSCARCARLPSLCCMPCTAAVPLAAENKRETEEENTLTPPCLDVDL